MTLWHRTGCGGKPPVLFLACGVLFLGGCAAASRVPPVVDAPAPIGPLPVEAPPPAALHPPSPEPPAVPAPAVEIERMMRIESDPPGAVIVVNGRPVGKAPVSLAVKATPQGFFEDYLDVRARFVATSADETSHTVEQEFTPREKVPALLRFTPGGVERTAR